MKGPPVKIYYIANARLPTEKAHGIQTAKMCEALVEAGADVELVVPRRATDRRSMKEFYGLRVDVPLTRVWTPDWYGRSRIGFWVSSCFFIAGYSLHIMRRRRRARPDIIWAIDIDQFSFVAVPFLGLPYIAEIHDAKKPTVPFRLLFDYACGAIVINRIIRREIIRTFCLPGDKVIVLPNGVDTSLFRNRDEDGSAARAALGIPEGRTVAMYVGRIYPWKGLEIMAAAARRLPNILFYIVGGTADQMRAIGFAGGQPENLVFAGERPFAEMPRWMRAAHMLIVTGTAENSYSFLHTSPMKIFEYMAAERPILAARTPAIQEIFTDDGQGVVFYEPDNIDDFVRSVAVLAARPDSHVAHQETYAYEWAYRAERALRFIGERV